MVNQAARNKPPVPHYKISGIELRSDFLAIGLHRCSCAEVSCPRFNLIPKTARTSAPHKKETNMKKLLAVALSLFIVSAAVVAGQNATSSTSAQDNSTSVKKRGPIFRATKEQINQAQALLKQRGFYSGEQTGKLDDATRDGLKKFQTAENIKVTGTLNRITLEKMGIELTDKQRAM
jgi:hypothetical protein